MVADGVPRCRGRGDECGCDSDPEPMQPVCWMLCGQEGVTIAETAGEFGSPWKSSSWSRWGQAEWGGPRRESTPPPLAWEGGGASETGTDDLMGLLPPVGGEEAVLDRAVTYQC